MRDTPYATEQARAEISEFPARIERLYVKKGGADAIRFSWWKDGKMPPRPLDIPEKYLLPLMQVAMRNGVFTDDFLRNLQSAITDCLKERR